MSLDQSLEELTRSVAVLEAKLGGKMAALQSEIESLRAGPAATGALPLGLGGGAAEPSGLQQEFERMVAEYDELKHSYAQLEQRHNQLREASSAALHGIDTTIAHLESLR